MKRKEKRKKKIKKKARMKSVKKIRLADYNDDE